MTQQVAEGHLRFPPVVLFTDGRDCWLGDGFHRVLAARKAGLSEIAANVRPGTPRDAVLFGISGHGLPRTNADKLQAVSLLLADPECGQWSDREIGRRCRLDHKVVSRMRRSLSGAKPHMRLSPAAEGRGIDGAQSAGRYRLHDEAGAERRDRRVRRARSCYWRLPATRRPIQWRRRSRRTAPLSSKGEVAVYSEVAVDSCRFAKV
jgi:hypothetical protein